MNSEVGKKRVGWAKALFLPPLILLGVLWLFLLGAFFYFFEDLEGAEIGNIVFIIWRLVCSFF